MKSSKKLLKSILLCLVIIPFTGLQAKSLQVVSSFSILEDMVTEIGGDKVEVNTIIAKNSDAHAFEPTPTNVKQLAKADVLVVNGLNFEPWLERLKQAAGFKALTITASANIKAIHHGDGGHVDVDLEGAERRNDMHQHGDSGQHDESEGGLHRHNDGLERHSGSQQNDDSLGQQNDSVQHDGSSGKHSDSHQHGDSSGQQNDSHNHNHSHNHSHGDIDPHAWQSLQNAIVYVKNIAIGLGQADPNNAEYYMQNADAYIQKIKTLDQEIKAKLEKIPESNRVVLTSHDSFAYFARDYNIKFIAIMGLSSTAEPSAKRIAEITNTIRDKHVNAIFTESMINNSLLQQIANETNAHVGGTLYSDALAKDNDAASTYLGMYKWNAEQILQALF